MALTGQESGGEAPAEERESLLMHVLSVLALLLGLMFLLIYGMMLVAEAWVAGTPAGLSFESSNYILAVGVGLLVLGLGMRLDDLLGFFRQRRGMQAVNTTLLVALAFALCVLLNYIFARHDLWRWDLTSERLYSLSPEALQALSSVRQDVRLVLVMPSSQEVEAQAVEILLDQFRAANPRVQVKRYSPDVMKMDQRQWQSLLDELGLDKGRGTYDDVLGVIIQVGRATDGGGWESIRSKRLALSDLWDWEMVQGRQRKVFRGEQKVSSAILELLEPKKPRIVFLTGHEERSFTDFEPRTGLSELGKVLRQKNYELTAVNLLQQEQLEVPADCDLLVLAAPRTSLTAPEAEAVERYLARGGDALLLLEPETERRAGEAVYIRSGLEDLLARDYGVEVEDRTLFWRVPTRERGGGIAATTQIFCDDFGAVQDDDQHQGAQVGYHPIVAPLAKLYAYGARVVFEGARPLRAVANSLATAVGMVKTHPQASPYVFSLKDPRARTSEDLQSGVFTLAVATSRPVQGAREDAGKEETRLVVVGDVDWLGNQQLLNFESRNLELVQNTIAWATAQEEKLIGKASRPGSYRLEMPAGQVVFFQLLALFGFPALAVSLGVFAWTMRRR